jgi:hypothetical protein
VIGQLHIGEGNVIVALVLLEFVLGPISTLLHELGHARVALRASPPDSKVTVVVGRRSMAFGVVFERLTIWWSPIPARGVFFRGVCVWDSRPASHRDRLRVSLAGPAVTALLIPTYVAAAIATASAPAWVPATFWLGALSCFVSCLVNLDPRTTAEERAARTLRRDGPRALAAYRAMRSA